MLSIKQQNDICLANKGVDECRYLNRSWNTSINKYVCTCQKKSINKQIIDDEVKEFEDECRKKNIDPRSQHHPLGNNCSGYLPLANINQGYDVK